MNFIALSIISFVILVALWVYHHKQHNKVKYLKEIIAIYKRQIDRMDGNWKSFEDIGAEFVDIEHAYACDLDIVGKKSLFQFLNTTSTWHGRQAFVNDLLKPTYKNPEIQERQKAISELAGDIDFSGKILYCLSKIGINPSVVDLVKELENKTCFVKNKIIKFLLTYIPILSLIFIIAMFIFNQPSLYLIETIIVTIQATAWAIGIPKTQKYLGTMIKLPYKLSSYSEAISVLTKQKFSSEKLKQIKKHLDVASKAIKDLGKIADKMTVKQNGLIWVIVNALFLWDYGCALSLEEWKNKYSSLAEGWFLTLGEFESLLSFSHLPNVCENTCLPTIAEAKNIIKAEDLGHPLLLNKIRVNNNFNLNNSIFVISGSNMSGKTTFLRTVGINLVLAKSGSFVLAKKMNCSLFDIATSMRIVDDLNEGTSTFYAELKRIKSIIDLARKQPNMVFLIDEIFKGTNSVDRLSGAKTVIEKLNALGVVGLISTHDLELCELASTYGRIKNCSFSEYYERNKICFDYKIKSGKSNTTNAKYLMEMLGIT